MHTVANKKYNQKDWELKINSDSYKLKETGAKFYPSCYLKIQNIIKDNFNINTTTNQVEILWEQWFKKLYGNSCCGASVFDDRDIMNVIDSFAWYMEK